MRRLFAVVTLWVLCATACGASLSPAIEVNSEEVSRSDLLDQTAALAEPLGVGSSTTASGQFTRDIILIRINEMLLNQAAADLDVEITDEHFAEAEEIIEADNAAQFPDPDAMADVVELLRRSVAAQVALNDTVDLAQVLIDGYSNADIFVDPRFGTWNPETGRVDAPPGPMPG